MRFSLLLGLAACTFEAPIIEPDPAGRNVIHGSLVVNGVDVPADTMVLIFDAEDPPPPLGTGGPISLSTVPAAAFTGPEAGIQAAPFVVTNLDDGGYIIQALMDLDGNFNPVDIVVGGATCGDVVGAHVTDLVSGTPAVVTVAGGQMVEDVTVVMGTVIPLQRPAFKIPEGTTVSRAGSLNPLTPQTFPLAATAIHTALREDFPLDFSGPCPSVPDVPYFCDITQLDPCDTTMWVHVLDENSDGLPDLRPDFPPEAGIPDIWPKIYLTHLGTDPAEGSWNAEAIPFLAEIGAMQFGAPQPIPFGQNLPLHTLSATWLPIAKHTYSGGAIEDEATGEHYDIVDLRATGDANAIPSGPWSVTVVLESGQTWQLPNLLGQINVSTQPEAYDPATQAGALIVE